MISCKPKKISQCNILPGIKPVLEILAQNPELLEKIYCSTEKHGKETERLRDLCLQNSVNLELTSPNRLAELCGPFPQTAHQGIIAILKNMPQLQFKELLESASSAPLPLLLALDQVQDPGNLGTICRTAWCLGCAGLILPKHNSALLSPAAARASAGCIVRLPLAIVTNLARSLDEAEEAGFTIYGASSGDCNRTNAFQLQWQLPAILVLGGEEHGIRPGVAKRCQTFLEIPFLRPFDSINVAQAGAMLIALCARQK